MTCATFSQAEPPELKVTLFQYFHSELLKMTNIAFTQIHTYQHGRSRKYRMLLMCQHFQYLKKAFPVFHCYLLKHSSCYFTLLPLPSRVGQLKPVSIHLGVFHGLGASWCRPDTSCSQIATTSVVLVLLACCCVCITYVL